jgi:hypothetical protein
MFTIVEQLKVLMVFLSFVEFDPCFYNWKVDVVKEKVWKSQKKYYSKKKNPQIFMKYLLSNIINAILIWFIVKDKHRGVRGIKVYPQTPKSCILTPNPYIPSLPKFGKNLIDHPPGFLNRVHLCSLS